MMILSKIKLHESHPVYTFHLIDTWVFPLTFLIVVPWKSLETS